MELTFRELHEWNLRYAALLDTAGVRPADFVATMIPNSIAAYNVWLGAAWLGAVEVPLNTTLRGARLQHCLNAGQVRHALVTAEFVPHLLEVAAQVPELRTVIVLDADEVPDLPWHTVAAKSLLQDIAPATGLDGPQPWDTMAVIFTSGTSGPSKPVVLPWRAMPIGVDIPGVIDLVKPGEAMYGSFPAFHASGKAALYIAVLARGHLVMRRQFSPSNFLADVRARNVTGAMLIGAMAQFLLNQPEQPDDADSPLQRVFVNPAPLNVEAFKRRFGVVTSTLYGSTELVRVLASPGYEPMDPTSCGRLLDDALNMEARIVDEHDREVPAGEVGELIVRCGQPWSIFQGYLGMPEATLATTRNGWFHTGDAMRRDPEGNFYFVDRINDAIRRRGENISSFEVEAFVNGHPAVAESAAIGLPTLETTNEHEIKVFVTLHDGQSVTPDELHLFLHQAMPRYMLPRYLEIIAEFPRTQTQKVQKVRLRELGLTAATWDSTAQAVG